MFTGIIEELGRIESIKVTGNSAMLKVGCKKVLERNENRR